MIDLTFKFVDADDVTCGVLTAVTCVMGDKDVGRGGGGGGGPGEIGDFMLGLTSMVVLKRRRARGEGGGGKEVQLLFDKMACGNRGVIGGGGGGGGCDNITVDFASVSTCGIGGGGSRGTLRLFTSFCCSSDVVLFCDI